MHEHAFRKGLAALHLGLAVVVLAASSGCKGCDDEQEEREELERLQDHYWRAQITIRGRGSVRGPVPGFDCISDGTTQQGECGPKLVKFKELQPAVVKAVPSPGWTFDHWESLIREPDGSVAPRQGPMPDGVLYVNGFGLKDTGQLDMVTAVFLPSGGLVTGASPTVPSHLSGEGGTGG